MILAQRFADQHDEIVRLRAALAKAEAERDALRSTLESHGPEGHNVTNEQYVRLRAALAKAEAELAPVEALLSNLGRSRAKYPLNRRMFDGLMGEVSELRRAYHGDGDITAEALDVAVCALRIALEGDDGGNLRLDDSPVAESLSLAEEARRG